jgi:hypothetical protein
MTLLARADRTASFWLSAKVSDVFQARRRHHRRLGRAVRHPRHHDLPASLDPVDCLFGIDRRPRQGGSTERPDPFGNGLLGAIEPGQE